MARILDASAAGDAGSNDSTVPAGGGRAEVEQRSALMVPNLALVIRPRDVATGFVKRFARKRGPGPGSPAGLPGAEIDYLRPMNFRSSAMGTAPRPWIGATVATFSFNCWTES